MLRTKLLSTTNLVLAGAAAAALWFPVGAHADTAAATATATTATAPEQGTSLQEVVVQARRTSENLQRVPVQVTVISQKAIDSAGVFGPQNLQALVPGLSVPAVVSDINNVVFAIRGQSYSYSAEFTAVIPYYAEVPINTGANYTGVQAGTFFDLENIQVLEGPQGTQFGRVTDGGNVMIYPKKPTNDIDGYVETKLGDYGLTEFDGAINLPIVPDKLMVRFAADVDHRDGYVQNLYNGQGLNDTKYEAYRVGVVFKPNDNFENYTSVQYVHTHDNGTAIEPQFIYEPLLTGLVGGTFGALSTFLPNYGINAQGNIVPAAQAVEPLTAANYLADLNYQLTRQKALGPFRVYDATPLGDRRDNIFVVNTTTANFNAVTVKNIFGYMYFQDFEEQNFAGGNGYYIDPCHSGCPFPNQQGIPFNRSEQFSEEFRLSGKLFNNRLSWSAGAYTDNQKPPGVTENAVLEFAILQRINVFTIKTWETAGYANLEYDLGDFLPGLKLNGGVRYTNDSNHSDVVTLSGFLPAPTLPAPYYTLPGGLCVDGCTDLRSTWHSITYAGGVTYQVSPNQMIYGKVTRGYRPGGVNESAPPGLNPIYNPEYDLSVEIGLKGDFNFNGVKARTDLALFHDNYTAIQQLVVLPPFMGEAVSVDRNVDNAIVQGIEFTGALIPVEGLTLGLTYAYTDAAFQHLPTDNPATNPTSPCVANTTGVGFCGENAFGFTPRNKVGLSVDYQLPLAPAIGTITFGGTWNYQSKEWLTTTSTQDPHAVQPAYSLLDLRATWRQIYGRPIDLSFFMTNVTNTIYYAGSDDLEQNVGTNGVIYAPPRMFGFGLKYRFGASAAE